jgi:hypothetical protein
MSYLDYETLESIDPTQFQRAKPYPWLNPAGTLTETGYQRLLGNLPDISIFEPMFGVKRSHGQRPHDRYVLEYRDKLEPRHAGTSSSPNFRASATAASSGACSAEAESSSIFTGITRPKVVPSRPTATLHESSAPTSFISTRPRTGTPNGAAKL